MSQRPSLYEKSPLLAQLPFRSINHSEKTWSSIVLPRRAHGRRMEVQITSNKDSRQKRVQMLGRHDEVKKENKGD